MNFIKKIVCGKIDESVHLQFQKFSKGEFINRALIEVKKTGKGYTIKTSAEFANELVRILAQKLGEEKTIVKGAIVSTSDLTGELKFKDKKQFQGVKRYLIESEMAGEEIINLLDKFPKNFFALSFKVGEEVLKIKPKAPKSGKPGKEKEGGPKADFCSLKTKNSEIVKSFIFEKSDFKEASVNHSYYIDEIIVPEELKSSSDFALVREESKRKGRIVRIANIDSEEVRNEYSFEA